MSNPAQRPRERSRICLRMPCQPPPMTEWHPPAPASTGRLGPLRAILTGQASTPATLVIDLFTRTGEFAEAFLKQRKNRSHTFFLGFCESQTEATYVETVLRSTLAEGYLAGGPMPAGDSIPCKVPEDILEAIPATPAMNLLVAELNYCFK